MCDLIRKLSKRSLTKSVFNDIGEHVPGHKRNMAAQVIGNLPEGS